MKKIILLILLISGALNLHSYDQKDNTHMNIVKGLELAISEYNTWEKDLITKVSEKLKANNYPLDELTRIHLKKRINSKREYYSKNEITFIINPLLFKSGAYNLSVQHITIVWEDPYVTYTEDGGMEFEIGRIKDLKELVLTLYGLKDSYITPTSLNNSLDILNKIHQIFLNDKTEEIKELTSLGLKELIINHLVVISENITNENIYSVKIKMIGHGVLDKDHFNEIDTVYSIQVDLNTSKLELIEKYYPTFYPTPYVQLDVDLE